MSTVIKLTGPARTVHGVAFNFDDMAGRANDYLDGVRKDAAKIIAAAKQEAEAVRRRAEEEGRQAVGKMLDEKVAKRMETLLPALKRVIEELHHAKQDWLNHWEKQAIHTAAALAARVVRRQLPQMPEAPLKLVREALELAAGSPTLRVFLHPADYETLKGQVVLLAKECARSAETEIIADPGVTPGGCRLETRHGIIDQQFEAQLARIEEELS